MVKNKETYKSLISENRLRESIDGLLSQTSLFIANNNDHLDIAPVKKLEAALIINSGKLKSLNQDKLKGIIDRETQNITNAEVQNAVLRTER